MTIVAVSSSEILVPPTWLVPKYLTMPPPLVSICIPAWERPRLLIETIESCLAQTYPNIEVVVTDDSRTIAVREAIEKFRGDARLRFFHNPKRLQQAGNVNKLFELAEGDWILLLHDDDLLAPDAIESLVACWDADPTITVAYGKPYYLSHLGTVLEHVTDEADRKLRRTARFAGRQQDALWSVLARQFPPNGFLVRTSAARAIKYRSYCEVGDACDLDFAVRLAQRYGKFFYINRHLSKYRYTDVSISTDTRFDPRYQIVRDLPVASELRDIKREYLDWASSAATRRHILAGERRQAWTLIRERRESMSDALKAAGLANLALLALPSVLVQALYRSRLAVRPILRRYGMVGMSSAVTRVAKKAWLTVRCPFRK